MDVVCIMGKGFKDEKGKFHPIGNYVSHTTHSGNSTRMIRGADTAQIFKKAINDYATKRKENFARQKEMQRTEFQNELEQRRLYATKIKRSYRKAKEQHITNPQALKKFIFSAIPDLSDDKDTLRFVQSIVNEYIEQEKHFKQSTAGKKADEIKKLETEFEASIKESDEVFKEFQDKATAKEKSDLKNKLEKQNELLEKEKKKREEVESYIKIKEQKEKELLEAEKQLKSAEEIKKKEDELRKAEQQTTKVESEEQKIQQDIAKEISNIVKEEKEPVEVGFPEGII